ncbi:hypothetical protein [Streptomyces microflavus]|uniref:hypothetical protein n=1 Tax=Streptomyces microflavus TaxID=1919 RepID=UPI0033C26A9C
MSVSLGKSGDALTTDDTFPALYLEISQLPDGRIATVTAADRPSLAESIFQWSPRTTIWTTTAPRHGSSSHAVKVLDLALSSGYRSDDTEQWTTGERATSAFYAHGNTDRATLRTVEAEIIRAGHLDVNTTVVQHQGYGLSVITGNHHGGHNDVFRDADGSWRIAMNDCTSYDGWYIYPGTLAPANATPRAVAAAILAHVYDGSDTTELRPRARLRVAFVQWRRTPHWANFKFHAGQWIARRRRRITVRLPRR